MWKLIKIGNNAVFSFIFIFISERVLALLLVYAIPCSLGDIISALSRFDADSRYVSYSHTLNSKLIGTVLDINSIIIMHCNITSLHSDRVNSTEHGELVATDQEGIYHFDRYQYACTERSNAAPH